MNGEPRLPDGHGAPRFPRFDVLAQAGRWDEPTRAVITTRLHALPPIRFFTLAEEAAAKALLDLLMGQDQEPGEGIDLVRIVDGRLAEHETDGWHYDTMPPDDQAWRNSLAGLDDDAREAHGRVFPDCEPAQQRAVLQAVQSMGDDRWHDMAASAVWSLWTRYAASAFYSHPAAWNEIGFSGPAYPRGYKNIGVDKLEPYEVHDAAPRDDPAAGGAR